MAEFVKVIKERERMCDSFDGCHDGCPIYKSSGTGSLCVNWMSQYPDEAERIILKWAAEHPEPDPMFEKLKYILESSKDDDLTCKIVKWFVEYYKNTGKEEENNG